MRSRRAAATSPEKRPFWPHVTLARVKRDERARAAARGPAAARAVPGAAAHALPLDAAPAGRPLRAARAPGAAVTRLYEAAVRPLLFRLEPERAHQLALRTCALAGRSAAGRGLAQRAFAVEDSGLGVELGGLSFENPLGLAAGFDRERPRPAAARLARLRPCGDGLGLGMAVRRESAAAFVPPAGGWRDRGLVWGAKRRGGGDRGAAVPTVGWACRSG